MKIMKLSNVTGKEFYFIGNKKILTESGERIDLNTDHFNKELESIKKAQLQL